MKAWMVAVAVVLGVSGNVLADRTVVDLSGPGWRLMRDAKATWEHDTLFLPPVDLSKVPTNAPTGGWGVLTDKAGMAVSVPGTAEEYLGDGGGASSGVLGVTWWYREIQVPADATQRLILKFESARQRTEVYVDGKLVGYDIVGNTPFHVDLSALHLAGKTVQLAVRITDPGGRFDWMDFFQQDWGKYKFPVNHEFSGITGRVKMVAADDVYCSDLYVQNTPAMRDVNMQVTVENTKPAAVQEDMTVQVLDGKKVVASRLLTGQELPPGETTVTVPMSVPDAKLWDTDHPNLYTARVMLGSGSDVTDHVEKRFGFRWFTVDGVGKDAVFRLNGKRIFLKTAISWGFWPTNGIFATPEMAEKQIRVAKSLGLNMLNFHRCIGSPVVLEKADELGLLYFEEPGAYVAGGKEPFGQAIARDKLLRMVKRDRSHPSLIIYNMINEQWTDFGADKDDNLFAIHEEDMRKAHALDPSRIILYTSSWGDPGKAERSKMHMLPFDDTPRFVGWEDSHRAVGPETWQQQDYRSPTQNIGYETDKAEIVYRGEEGAISTPPRLALIHKDLQKLSRPGWDGAVYEQWYQAFKSFLDRKDLRGAFPTVDAFTSAMGDVSLENQGRRIETHRIGNIVDGYAVNGWEAELIEDHSGIVDCFRNPKGHPEVMARRLQPLYVAVMPRKQVLAAGSPAVVDFYVVNEKNVTGPERLEIEATDAKGNRVFSREKEVSVAGGDTFGQLLDEGVQIAPADGTAGAPGMWKISASLVDENGKTVATGWDNVLVVDWRSDPITGRGAVYEHHTHVRDFLRNSKGVDVPAYRDDMGKLDWVVVTAPMFNDPGLIPSSALRDAGGTKQGLTATFYEGKDFEKQIYQRTDPEVNLDVSVGATPDPNVAATGDYSIRWEGSLVPPVTGDYRFVAGGDDGVRVWIDGKEIIDDWGVHAYREQQTKAMHLEGGKPVPVKVEYFQDGGGAKCTLQWISPATQQIDADRLMQRAVNDGTTVILMDRPDSWLDVVQKYTNLKCAGTFSVGTNWLGGQFFVKKHPLLEGLPVDCAMNWPYQRVVRSGTTRFGMELEGEELVAGAYQSWPMALGTAIGVVPCGKGRIVLSSLEIAGAVEDTDSSAEVARKMLCNYIRFAEAGHSGE